MSGIRTEEQENSPELHIVKDVLTSTRPGRFVECVFEGFQIADRDNFEIMRPIVRYLIKKYDFKCDCHRDVVLLA